MKKIIAFILALTMIFALCACGSTVEPSVSDSQSTEPTDSAETEMIQTENDSTSDEEIEKQEFDYAEQQVGLWLCTDHVNSDKTVDFMFLTDDGYILRNTFDVFTNEFFILSNYITLIGDSPSSELHGINKYEINNDEMVITHLDGETEVLGCSYYPIISMEEFVIRTSDEEVHYSRYNWFMDDSFRYFVGNWNYEKYTYFYDSILKMGGESNYSGSLFFGENFRANESAGATFGWGYNNNELEIDGSSFNVIKLSPNKFVIYYESEGETDTDYYSLTIYDRA